MQTQYLYEFVSCPLFFCHSIRYQLYDNRYIISNFYYKIVSFCDWIKKIEVKGFLFMFFFLNGPVHLQSECWHNRHNNKMLKHHARFLRRFHFVLLISDEVKIGVYMGWCSSVDSKVLGFPPSCLHFGIKDKDHSTIHINLKQRK